MFARNFIDSLDFAHNGRDLHGIAPLVEMSRLLDILADPVGELSYTVYGLPNGIGKPMLEISVEGQCQLRCQRCLGGFTYPIKMFSRLQLASASELDDCTVDDNDEVDSIAAEKHLDVLNMIEEEILLNLPFAPKHPLGDCQSIVEALSRSEPGLFAVLASLKDK